MSPLNDGCVCPLDIEMGGIGAGGGFLTHTEYELAASRIGEAAHCLLGSLYKSQRSIEWVREAYEPPYYGEQHHINEEMGIIRRSADEYSRPIYLRIFHDPKFKEWREKSERSIPIGIDDIRKKASDMKDSLAVCCPDSHLGAIETAEATYDMLLAMADGLELSAATNYRFNAYAHPKFQRAVKKLEDIVDKWRMK